jgi:phenylacetate-coenzyme A ligase PaaK-like adenylate-forming protein
MELMGNYESLINQQRADQADALFSSIRRLGWSAERLAVERERRLREMLLWSTERSSFWRKRLEGLDLATFTEAQLPNLPILTKAQVMDNFEGIITNPALTFERVNNHVNHLDNDAYLDDSYRAVVTSGTGGIRGLFVYGWDEWITFSLIATRWRGRTGEDPYAPVGTFFATNTKHVSGALHAFSQDFSGNGSLNVTHLPAFLPIPEIVAGLNAARPTTLVGYASVILLLALEAQAGRLTVDPTWVATSGEQCTDEIKDAVRQAWGIEIYDSWGCTEGVFAYPCQPGWPMHLPDDLAIIEPVDENGHPVPFGQPSAKILLTNLYNKTQPLFRYEINDAMTIIDDPCECGSGHRRISEIGGRIDGFFTYENGTTIHRLGMESVILGDPSVVEMQVTQTKNGMVVNLVTRGNCDTAVLKEKLITLMNRSGLALPEVDIHEVDSLARMWSGKLRQFEPLKS